MDNKRSIEKHYGRGGIRDAILNALSRAGKDLTQLNPIDLAPVDEFHVRGRDATVELAGRAGFGSGQDVLDVGCGLGGSARYLATEYGCQVTGIDLTQEYVDLATELAQMVGLGEAVKFQQGSALELPFPDRKFDMVWTEHAQMNIEDKVGFYGEIARVLKPGGRLAFHDIFEGTGGELRYPVPWAEDSSISSLTPLKGMRDLLESVGLLVVQWVDKSAHSQEWFEAMTERIKVSGPPPVGLHLLTGKTAAEKFSNALMNIKEKRIVVLQGVLERSDN